MKKCFFCSNAISPEAAYCFKCGIPLSLTFLELPSLPSLAYFQERIKSAARLSDVELFDFLKQHIKQHAKRPQKSQTEQEKITKRLAIQNAQNITESIESKAEEQNIPEKLSQPETKGAISTIASEVILSNPEADASKASEASDDAKKEPENTKKQSESTKKESGDEEIYLGMEDDDLAEFQRRESLSQENPVEKETSASSAQENKDFSLPNEDQEKIADHENQASKSQPPSRESGSEISVSDGAKVSVDEGNLPHQPSQDKKPSNADLPVEKEVERSQEKSRESQTVQFSYCDKVPKEFEYCTFESDKQKIQDKGYEIVGRTQSLQYDFLAFPVNHLSLQDIWKEFDQTERQEMIKMASEGQYWEIAGKVKKRLPSLKFRRIEKLAKKYLPNTKNKNIFCIPKIPSENHKQIIQSLKEGKTLDAIYQWRRLTGIGLQQSRWQIEYLCEERGISCYPTQIDTVPSLWQSKQKIIREGGIPFWFVFVSFALGMVAGMLLSFLVFHR